MNEYLAAGVRRDVVLVYCEDDNEVVLYSRDLDFMAACTCGWRGEARWTERDVAENEGFDHAMTHAIV